MNTYMESDGWLFAVKRWHVAFMPGPVRGWWDLLCREDMRHVFCFGWCDWARCWIVVDQYSNGLRIRPLPDGQDFYDELMMWKASGMKALEIDARENTDLRMKLMGWCVPVVASVIGVGAGALRPQGLYRKMLENGATPSFEDGDSSESQRTKGRS